MKTKTSTEVPKQAEAEPTQANAWVQIESLSQKIAENSDVLREKMVAISEEVGKVVAVSGIGFGGVADNNPFQPTEEDDWWRKDYGAGELPSWFRPAIRKYGGKWQIVIEETEAHPSNWDGNNWAGYEDPFDTEYVRTYTLQDISRWHLAILTEKLPKFLENYLNHLKEKHKRYSDVKKMAEKMAESIKTL